MDFFLIRHTKESEGRDIIQTNSEQQHHEHGIFFHFTTHRKAIRAPLNAEHEIREKPWITLSDPAWVSLFFGQGT